MIVSILIKKLQVADNPIKYDWRQNKGHTKKHHWKIIVYPNDGHEQKKR